MLQGCCRGAAAHEAVLLAIGEAARVDAAVCVGELALAVAHARLVLALVRVAVGEDVLPSAVHRVVHPLALVHLVRARDRVGVRARVRVRFGARVPGRVRRKGRRSRTCPSTQVCDPSPCLLPSTHWPS